MMLSNAPRLTGLWSGTGTRIVIVSPLLHHLMTPSFRTAANPFCSSMRQISDPERTRSLPNRNLDLSYENLVAKTPCDFGRVGCLEEQREALDKVRTRLFNGRTLTRDVQFWAQRHETVALAFNNGGQGVRWSYDQVYSSSPGRVVAKPPKCADYSW